VPLHDGIRRGQAQPPRLLFRGKEWIKDAAQEIRRNADTEVLHANLDVDPIRQMRRPGHVVRAHPDGAATRRGFDRIQNHVADHLRKLIRISVQVPQSGRQLDLALHIRPAQNETCRVAE